MRADVGGGDPFGRGDQPRLSWWLPPGAVTQHAYRIVTDDGYDTGRVESADQVRVGVSVFDRSRRATAARVMVWTELGASTWSDPVELDSGLLDESDWSAQWVGVAEDQRPEKGLRPAYWLRARFELTAEQAADGARLEATALGLYEVHLNGQRVGDEELAPGYTQYARRVQAQSHDVSDLVLAGENVVAVLVSDGWYRGQVGLPRAADQYGTDLALRLQIDVPDAPIAGPADPAWLSVVATGPDWRWSTSHITVADLIGGQREDRRLVDPSLHTPAYDDSSWLPVVPREVTAAVVRPVAPPVRRIEELRPVSVARVGEGGDHQVVDLGQNINGWARLSRLGPEGTRLVLRHGEHLGPDGDLTTTHLDVDVPIFPEALPVGQVDEVTSAGRPGDVFEPRFTTHGFRYVRVEGHPDELTPEDVTGVVVHSDLRRTGWFECSDERVNALHEAVVWSLRDNICDIPTDCPQRERSGWTGDWQIFAPTAAYLFDVLGFTRKWLRDVALDQRADGCVANISPCPPIEGFSGPVGHVNGSAGWGDVVVSAPWDLHEAYADASLLRELWGPLTAWVDYAARAARDQRHPFRAATRPEAADHEQYLWDAGFHWGEWLEPDADLSDFGAFAAQDQGEVATAYLHRSAATAARIGGLIGADAAQVEHYATTAERARAAWQAEFVRPDGSLRTATQAAHVRALAFGLVADEHRQAVADELVRLIEAAGTHLGTGFLSTPMLLPVLADHGHLETAYALLLQDSEPSWLTMLDRGATTVWERWNGVDAAGVAHESLNHYSKGAVVSFLHRYVAGLRPASPGYRSFEVRPRPGGGLTSAHATLESPYGRIETAWRLDAGVFTLDVAVPGAATAEVVLPQGGTHRVGPGRHTWSESLPTL
ncbi:Bacterial alpha-L-rhamnosidase [Nostocoides sp. HKS02]|nr:Bacterial alpha-L-rhamnosidase [Tetrasphaera sp. HKS02]